MSAPTKAVEGVQSAHDDALLCVFISSLTNTAHAPSLQICPPISLSAIIARNAVLARALCCRSTLSRGSLLPGVEPPPFMGLTRPSRGLLHVTDRLLSSLEGGPFAAPPYLSRPSDPTAR